MLTPGLGCWTPCPVSVVLIIMASLIILFTWCGPHMSSFGLAGRKGCELEKVSYGHSEEAIPSVTSPGLFHMKTNHSSELQEVCCFSNLKFGRILLAAIPLACCNKTSLVQGLNPTNNTRGKKRHSTRLERKSS